MVWFCADDYGLCESVSARILECVSRGALNKVSVFPNFGVRDLSPLLSQNIRVSLHLNLVEGVCMGPRGGLLSDENGVFRYTFFGLLMKSLFAKRRFEAAVKEEIRAQVRHWRNLLPQGAEFCVDSHQHTHMIPAVFRSLMAVLDEEGADLSYLRIPREPTLPYLKTPSLFLTYSPINGIKHILLNLLWLRNRREGLPSARFCGILFSGRMDASRLAKLLPKYKADGRDLEVLFHPGYADGDLPNNIVFQDFYNSKNRKLEFDSVLKLSEGSVTNNGLH